MRLAGFAGALLSFFLSTQALAWHELPPGMELPDLSKLKLPKK